MYIFETRGGGGCRFNTRCVSRVKTLTRATNSGAAVSRTEHDEDRRKHAMYARIHVRNTLPRPCLHVQLPSQLHRTRHVVVLSLPASQLDERARGDHTPPYP